MMEERIIGERFRLIYPLTEDGELWHAVDTETGSESAIRLIPLSPTGHMRWVRFESELDTLSKICHKGLTRIIEWGDCEGGKYIATESIIGTPLKDAKLSLVKSIQVLISIASVLDAVSSCETYLKELKPSNILLLDGPEVQVKIIDTAIIASDQTKLKQVKQSEIANEIAWLPPEVLRGEQKTIRSNLYSLGLIGYNLICGKPPFLDQATSSLVWQIQNSPAPPISLCNSSVPLTLDNVIRRLLRKDPKSRYSSPIEVQRLLETSLRELKNPQLVVSRSGVIINKGFLVGRGEEYTRLKSIALSPTKKLSIAIIEGEDGLGKTRLLQEAMSAARASDMLVLWASCEKSHALKPFNVISQLVSEAVTHLGVGTIAKSEYKNILASICPNLTERMMFDPNSVQQDPLTLVTNAPKALVWLLKECAKESKTIIAIDDFQYCDEDSVDVILCALGETANLPVSIMATTSKAKDNFKTEILATRPEVQRIKIKPLSPLEMKNLVTSLLSFEKIKQETFDLLIGLSKGNVMFMLQALAGLAARGHLDPPFKHVDIDSLPKTLDGLASWRIDALEAKTKSILSEASILGDSFDEQTLLDISSSSEAEVEEVLDNAVQGMIIALFRSSSGYKYRFINTRMRERLLEELSPKQKSVIFDKAAKALTKRYGDNVAPRIDDLICYLSQSSNPSKAIPYLTSASKRAENTFNSKAALDYSRKALDLAIRSADSVLEAEAALRVSDVLFTQGRLEEAEKILEGILNASRKVGIDSFSEADLLLGLANINKHLSHFGESERFVQEAYKLVGKNYDESRIAKIHLQESQNQQGLSSQGMLTHAQKALAKAKESADEDLMCEANIAIATAQIALGRLTQAKNTLKTAQGLANKLENLRQNITIMLLYAQTSILLGQNEDAEKEIETAKEISVRLDSKILEGKTLFLDAIIRYGKGDLDSVRRIMERAIELFTQAKFIMPLVDALVQMAEFHLGEGDIEGARYYLARCKEFEKAMLHLPVKPSAISEAGILIEESLLDRAKSIAFEALNHSDGLSAEERFKLLLVAAKIKLTEGDYKGFEASLNDAQNSTGELTKNPTLSNEACLLWVEFGLKLLYKGAAQPKAKRATFFGKTGFTQPDLVKLVKENLDKCLIHSLLAGKAMQSYVVSMDSARLNAILPFYEPDKKALYKTEAKRYLRMAKELLSDTRNQFQIYKIQNLLEIIENDTPPDEE